jgi:hypothetical protein
VAERARLRIFAGTLVGIIRSATSGDLLHAVEGQSATDAAGTVAQWLKAAASQAGPRPS